MVSALAVSGGRPPPKSSTIELTVPSSPDPSTSNAEVPLLSRKRNLSLPTRSRQWFLQKRGQAREVGHAGGSAFVRGLLESRDPLQRFLVILAAKHRPQRGVEFARCLRGFRQTLDLLLEIERLILVPYVHLGAIVHDEEISCTRTRGCPHWHVDYVKLAWWKFHHLRLQRTPSVHHSRLDRTRHAGLHFQARSVIDEVGRDREIPVLGVAAGRSEGTGRR
mmetsp:Transcript_57478/g.153179  ORF Transcript_57478/g.153179 Transcript_57478/m.153179 type:complete len:221 (+) Transcript_57478:84-746(+)